MKFKAVIFDLDGTLLNTLDDLADSMNRVLERNRLPQHDPAAYKYFVGDGIEMLVRRALPFEVAGERDILRFVAEMKNEYASRWLSKTRPYPGIPEMLAAFAAAGLAMAVLSNKPDDASNEIVKALLPGVAFRVVLGATPERPKKPDPSAALEIAARLAIPAEDFLFVGDTSIDMQTACAAGMFPVGVLWGFRPAEELIASGAKVLAAEAQNLIPLIFAGWTRYTSPEFQLSSPSPDLKRTPVSSSGSDLSGFCCRRTSLIFYFAKPSNQEVPAWNRKPFTASSPPSSIRRTLTR